MIKYREYLLQYQVVPITEQEVSNPVRKYVNKCKYFYLLTYVITHLFLVFVACTVETDSTQLNSTQGWLNKGKEARKLKNIPDSLNDSQVFFWKYL